MSWLRNFQLRRDLGLLTHVLLRFLKGLEPTAQATTTYRRLLAAVRHTCQSETNDQFPILFGDDSKSIFGLTSTSISESNEAIAHVQRTDRARGVMTLDRGELDGVVLGDHYQILERSGKDTGILLDITKVEPLRAHADKTVSGSIRVARNGWSARFAGRDPSHSGCGAQTRERAAIRRLGCFGTAEE